MTKSKSDDDTRVEIDLNYRCSDVVRSSEHFKKTEWKRSAEMKRQLLTAVFEV